MERKLKPFEQVVELSNGDEAVIRPMGAMDFVAMGEIPDLDQDPEPVKNAPAKPIQKADVERLILMLTRGVVVYYHKGEAYQVVDKDPFLAGEQELSVSTMPDTIQTELVMAITRASGVPDLGNFPEGDGDGGGDRGHESVPGDAAE